MPWREGPLRRSTCDTYWPSPARWPKSPAYLHRNEMKWGNLITQKWWNSTSLNTIASTTVLSWAVHSCAWPMFNDALCRCVQWCPPPKWVEGKEATQVISCDLCPQAGFIPSDTWSNLNLDTRLKGGKLFIPWKLAHCCFEYCSACRVSHALRKRAKIDVASSLSSGVIIAWHQRPFHLLFRCWQCWRLVPWRPAPSEVGQLHLLAWRAIPVLPPTSKGGYTSRFYPKWKTEMDAWGHEIFDPKWSAVPRRCFYPEGPFLNILFSPQLFANGGLDKHTPGPCKGSSKASSCISSPTSNCEASSGTSYHQSPKKWYSLRAHTSANTPAYACICKGQCINYVKYVERKSTHWICIFEPKCQ